MLHQPMLKIVAAGLVAIGLLAACSAPAPTPAAITVLPTPTPAPAQPPAAPDQSADPAPIDLTQLTIGLVPVYEGYRLPVYLTHAGDDSGRTFIVEKGGTIRIIADGAPVEAPFLDISDRVRSSGNEQGLLGLAFAPDYATSGFFFVNYTDGQGHTVVSRFQVSPDDPNRADPSGEFVVLTIDQPASNHNGGMVAFGPDGYLWIGTGDGGASNDRFGNGQNPNSLLGKMLRLDVTTNPDAPYTVPVDNPWLDADWNGQPILAEVWAVGLRNPWRYSFDRLTGDLWMADVGQNQIEEINFTPANDPGALNFGWPIMEGDRCFQTTACDPSGLVLPAFTYGHEGHCSVTGGYVYRGQDYPAMYGAYIFGDYCSGAIWATVSDGAGGWATELLLRAGITLSSFGEDEAGELYATDLNSGTIYRITAQ